MLRAIQQHAKELGRAPLQGIARIVADAADEFAVLSASNGGLASAAIQSMRAAAVEALELQVAAPESSSQPQQAQPQQARGAVGKRRQELLVRCRSAAAESVDLIRDKLLLALDIMFNRIVSWQLAEHLPLREALFVDLTGALRHQLMPRPRSSMFTALAQPSRYIACRCCDGAAQAQASMHDTCIAYAISSKGGRLIALREWLMAFDSAVRGQDGEARPRKRARGRAKGTAAAAAEKPAEVGDEIKARFTRAAAELQFIGAVGPYPRRSDYVCRLAFDPRCIGWSDK